MRIPILPSRMNTRPSNKDKHPGIVDLAPDKKPCRTEEEAAQARQEAEKRKEQRTKVLKDAASIEDGLVREDEQRERERTRSKASDASKNAIDDTNAVTAKHGQYSINISTHTAPIIAAASTKSKKKAQNEPSKFLIMLSYKTELLTIYRYS